jgi:phytoene dehydrogenase-like protein
MDLTIREWMDRNLTHAEVKEFLLAAFRLATYANAPHLMSAGTAIEQLQKAFDKSVLYLDGGWQTLVDGLREAATRAGVVIETAVKVESIIRDTNGAVEKVRLADSRSLQADIVVIAASPSVAAELVDGAQQTSLARWADQAIPVRAACLDVALTSLPVPKATFALGIDRPLYLSVHSAAAHLAPEDAALIQVAKYLPAEHPDPPEDVERELEGLLDLVQPQWREAVVYKRFLPAMIVMNAMPLASLGGARGRPDPEVSDVPGLFVVGDWVGKEGLLVDAALSSARHASDSIVARQASRLAAVV